MIFDLNDALAVLSRTPAILKALLKDVPQNWVSGNEGPDTWSPYDVVGHFIHGEKTDWMPRVKIVLECGETRAFEPFDRFAQFSNSKGKPLADLLEEFTVLREQNLLALRQLNVGEFDLEKGGRHPDFGRVTLKELLATWVVHDLDHIVQIARTMAKQYASEVGPWRAYLSVLHWRRTDG
jgi:hypothetical protein